MKQTVLACLLLVLSACAGAPVQEMSDARQAIRAAQAAGAEQRAPQELGRAEALIDEAQRLLQRHEYRAAERNAIEARETATQALEIARAAAAGGR